MFNRLAAGQKLYGNGSYAPTRGQVSAQGAAGYLKRELTNRARQGNRNLYGGVSKTGRDGQSDTRSGVTAKTLSRTQTKHNPPGYNPPNPQGGKNGPMLPGPPPPPVINKDGILELPYNQEFSTAILGATQDMNQKLLDLQAGQQQEALGYNQGVRQTEQDYAGLKRATLNDNAGRGTIFSSGYGQAVGNNAAAYNNQMNDLNTQHALFNSDIDRQRLGIQTAFQNMLSQFALEQANTASADAGNLGLYVNPVRDTRKKKGKKKGGKKK